MTRAKRGKSKSTARHIQFNWNSKDEVCRAALDVLDRYKVKYPTEERLTATLLAEALIAFDGKELPKRATQAAILTKLERLEVQIEQSQAQMHDLIINALRNLDLSQYVNVSSNRTIEDDLGELIPEHVYENIIQDVQGKTFDVD